MSDNNLLSRLQELRYNFSDEIPDIILHSNMGQPKYKVRNGWFQAIIADGEIAILDNAVSQRSEEVYNKFYEWYTSNRVFYRLKTREDIQKGDEVLDSMIHDLTSSDPHSN